MAKKYFLVFQMLFMAVSMAFSQSGRSLVVESSGETTELPLGKITSIKYDGDRMVVNSADGSSLGWETADIATVLFSTATTGIDGVGSEMVKFSSGVLHVSAPAGTPVRIYSANGLFVAETVVAEGGVDIDMRLQLKGGYIVNIGKDFFKLINR